jgi:hypothetical protein
MTKQVSASTDDPEITTKGATEDDSEQPSRNLDLSDLANRMDGDARSRAVQRILAHHAALRADLDKTCAKVGAQAEEIARLQTRLALLEGDGETEEENEEEVPAKKSKGAAKGKAEKITSAPVGSDEGVRIHIRSPF